MYTEKGLRRQLAIITIFFLVIATSYAQIFEDFESYTSGTIPAGWTNSGTTTTGSFVIGEPNEVINGGVITQVNGDHSPIGVNAFYSQFNSGAGTVDIDGGVVVTTSPVYSVPMLSSFSMWYFFGQRDSGDDPSGDFFLLEISFDGGSSFSNLVNIGDISTNAVWTEVTTTIPAGSNVVIRVSASDGAGAGDLIEAGIDDINITPLAPNISITDISISEFESAVEVEMTHEGLDVSGSFTVDFATIDNTALGGSDYVNQTGTLSFSGTVGDTQTVTINLLDDIVIEGDETFFINLSNVSNTSVDITDQGVVTIIDVEIENTRPYEERFKMNLRGNFEMIGNTNLECTSNCGSPTTNNPPVVMGYTSIDGTTINSSSANLNLPAGGEITWVGLYWGGAYSSNQTNINPVDPSLNLQQVRLREPGMSTYTTINASITNIETGNFGATWNTFMSFTDITSIVKNAGSGTYTVADIALITGSGFTGPFGGWTMVVVYEDPADITRSVSIWDGFDFFGFGANDVFTVTGLLTPSLGGFDTKAGYFGMDGEANQVGDFVGINGTALTNALNPADNTLNSTISNLGVDIGERNPNQPFNWGIDIDTFDATGLVPNSATDIDVSLGSANEGIWGGVFALSTEVAFPTVANKTFTPDTVGFNEISTVSITIENPATGVNLTNLSLSDNLPVGMIVATVPNTSSSCGGTINAVPGSNTFTVSGLNLNVDDSCTFTFDVIGNVVGNHDNIITSDDITNDQGVPLSASAVGTLNVIIRSVITNRRITYRVKL